jgi:hypothetical protein
MLERTIETWLKTNKNLEAVIIDEVQKVPKLLGGRANTYALYPLSYGELGDVFDLDLALQWGTLPECWGLSSDRERTSYLRSYCNTYLKEEVFIDSYQVYWGIL